MPTRRRTNRNSEQPLGYQMRNRDPERQMARGAQAAIQSYARRAAYNARRRKSNGGMGG